MWIQIEQSNQSFIKLHANKQQKAKLNIKVLLLMPVQTNRIDIPTKSLIIILKKASMFTSFEAKPTFHLNDISFKS